MEILYMSCATVVGRLLTILLIASLAVARWKIFGKAGKKESAAVIPFYSSFMLFRLADAVGIFWPWIVCVLIYSVGYVFSAASGIMFVTGMVVGAGSTIYEFLSMLKIGAVVMGISGGLSMLFTLIMNIRLARNFGKGAGYALGIFFLPNIFYMLLAFQKNIVYKAKKED